jgi:peroxiredoxin
MKSLKLISIVLLLSIEINCKANNRTIDYLQKVLKNLEKIESATYFIQVEGWQHGDTTAQFVRCEFIKEFDNPADTTIGASYVSLDCNTRTRLDFGYDGKIKVSMFHEHKGIFLDDFTKDTRNLPFRVVTPPFFNNVRNIIQYAITTTHNVALDLKEFDDHYYFKLVIDEDKQVEFFGKAHYIPENPYTLYPTSIYELWINKSDNLPYKIRREMSHDISVRSVSNVELNTLSIADFNIYDYFPSDYEVRKYEDRNRPQKESNLIGKKAPIWTLNDKDEQSVSLSDSKGKITLIQFTGIGCGPCVASIPFLKELKEKYSENDFELIVIESWSRKPQALQNYSKRHELNYNVLSATDEIIKSYETGNAAPVFLILDREQIIRKVINGYKKETTGEEIMNTINELL